MLHLTGIDEHNFTEARQLRVHPEQEGFLDSAVGILARGYVYRNCRARVIGIASDDTLVGLALVKDMDEEPACYDLQQFMIDARFQNRGYGTEALRLILREMEAERKYDCVEVCVKQTDAAALHVYETVGFVDTGYIDPDAQDCRNLTVRFERA